MNGGADPQLYGGFELVDNIVRFCMMYNMIKSARPCGLFVAHLRKFLGEHGRHIEVVPDFCTGR
jgi:hypothetical protein